MKKTLTAVDYINKKIFMCKHFQDCKECPMSFCPMMEQNEPKKAIEIVNKFYDNCVKKEQQNGKFI